MFGVCVCVRWQAYTVVASGEATCQRRIQRKLAHKMVHSNEEQRDQWSVSRYPSLYCYCSRESTSAAWNFSDTPPKSHQQMQPPPFSLSMVQELELEPDGSETERNWTEHNGFSLSGTTLSQQTPIKKQKSRSKEPAIYIVVHSACFQANLYSSFALVTNC